MDLKKYGKFILGAFLLYSGVVVLFSQKQEIINTWQEYSVSTNQAEVSVEQKEISLESDSVVESTPESVDESKLENISSISQNEVFKDVITLALGIFAFMKWIDFFALFKPESALSSLMVPALTTFLSLKWQALLAWFQLG